MPTPGVLIHDCPNPLATTNRFRVRLAQTVEDLEQCQRLRYEVFNCELGEGLDRSSHTRRDCDPYDLVFDHLMVLDATTEAVVGTYRMQSGYRALGNLGYYGEQLFDFRPFETIRSQVLELGRACVHEHYRNTHILHLLWKGIARYASACNARFLIGCSSLSSQNENAATALYETLRERLLVEPALRTGPAPGHECKTDGLPASPLQIPRLFRAYLEISARVCGPPAIDREFRTIDFLTLLDLQRLPKRVRSRFF